MTASKLREGTGRLYMDRLLEIISKLGHESLSAGEATWLRESILMPLADGDDPRSIFFGPAPGRPADAHRREWSAIDYTLHRLRGERAAAKVVARRWGISPASEINRAERALRTGIAALVEQIGQDNLARLVERHLAQHQGKTRPEFSPKRRASIR
jgi:hypothetical protein